MKKLVRRKNPDKLLEESIKNPVKTVQRIFYKKAQCEFVNPDTGERCPLKAAGRDTVCMRHGGDRFAREAMLKPGSNLSLPINSKYNPLKHPIQYMEFSRNGMSDVEIAAQFGVSLHIIYKWSETYEEFNVAYECGKALHEAWYLRVGKENLENRFFQTPLFKFLTGNKLGYSDKIETKNLNQNQYGVLLVPGSVSVDEWEKEQIEREKREAIDV